MYAHASRGCAALTRGYRVVRPLWGRQPRRHPIAPPTRRGCLRRSAIPGAHTAARTTRKGRMPRRDYRPKRFRAAGKPPLLSHPGGERRDESRLYASKFPCGTMFAAVRSHTTRQAPLSGANYSITAGKRSAPAESRRIYMWAPRGSNTREVAPRTPHTRSAQCVLPRGRSTPLGPKWRGEPCPRARCAYPRL